LRSIVRLRPRVIASGENELDLQAYAKIQVPLRLTGEAVIAGLLATRAAAE
jgi:hypothetical protein